MTVTGSTASAPANGSRDPVSIGLPCLLLLLAMFNLTLVVAGLKEFILDDLGGSVADATWFFSVETLAHILFAPLWGLLSDRVGRRKPFIVLGFFASALLYFSFARVEDVGVLLALRFLQGACSVMGWSLLMAMVLDRTTEELRGRYSGMMGASLILGVSLGAPVGGLISRELGPRAPLLAAAVLFLVVAAGSFLLQEPTRHVRQITMSRILGTVRQRPRLLMPMAFHFVDRFTVGFFVVVFPLYLDSLGAHDPAVRGRYLALYLLPFAVLQLVTGRLVERIGPMPLLMVGSLAYGIMLSTVGFSDLLMLWPVMIALGVLAAVMFPPTLTLTSRFSEPATRGTAMGGFNVAGSLGFAIGPIVGGWAYALRGYGFAFVLSGAMEILAAIVALAVVLRWRSRRS